ncbi:hypothetical protein LEP1GSC061_1765 [Leptospira wolffii serovar Khorat str. Khorat-H2]|nr:hypothetical protein LEP1GSC061_1765 [Leptospira wolffii serovar Khorat str. Khorat-H2]
MSKFKMKPKDFREILSHLKTGATILEPKGKPPTVCKDPNNNPVLHLAEYSEAELLLTGDTDLLVIGVFARAKILSPRQYKLKYLI